MRFPDPVIVRRGDAPLTRAELLERARNLAQSAASTRDDRLREARLDAAQALHYEAMRGEYLARRLRGVA